MYADRPDTSDTATPGLFAKLFGRFFSPVLLTSYTLSLVVTGVIFVNALLLQPSDFSAPVYLTSETSSSPPTPVATPTSVATPTLTSAATSTSPTPQRRVEVITSASDDTVSQDIMSVLDSSAIPSPPPSSSSPPSSPSSVSVSSSSVTSDILREIQAELLSRGYYTGDIDGKYGDNTRDAILSFERAHSLPETGIASDLLLGRLLLASSAADASPPVVLGVPSRVAVPRTRLVPNVDLSDTSDTPTSGSLDSSSSILPSDDSDLVARIQLGLRNYGYDDVEVDGRSGERTKTAIQRFELEYGMTITGEPTVEVLDKLRQIGAYTQG